MLTLRQTLCELCVESCVGRRWRGVVAGVLTPRTRREERKGNAKSGRGGDRPPRPQAHGHGPISRCAVVKAFANFASDSLRTLRRKLRRQALVRRGGWGFDAKNAKGERKGNAKSGRGGNVGSASTRAFVVKRTTPPVTSCRLRPRRPGRRR